MVSFVATVLRGLRARALLSVGSVALIAIALGAAMLGPMFQDAAGASYVVSRVQSAPALETGVSTTLHPSALVPAGAEGLASAAVRRVQEFSGPTFRRAQSHLVSVRFPALTGEAMLQHTPEACSHLEVAGRCPRAPGETILSAADASYLDVAEGDRLELPAPWPDLVVVGTYRVPEDPFWFDVGRLASHPARAGGAASTPYRPGPLFVVAGTFSDLPRARWQVRVDSRLTVRPDRAVADLALADQRVAALDRKLEVPEGVLRPATSNALNDLDNLVAQVRLEQRDARLSVAPATASLVLIALVLLLRLLTAAAELRLPELAVAALRGTGRRRLWLLGLAEPVALIVLALLPGLALGFGLGRLLVRSWLVPGLPVPLPWTAIAGVSAVVVAALGVSVLAVNRVVRAPLAEQLDGVRRPGAASRAVVVLFLLCGAAVLVLVAGSFAGGSARRPDVGDFLLPILLAVVAGVTATWAVARLAGRRADRHRDDSLSGFVAARAVSRRTEGTVVVLPLTAALAIGVFALGVDDAAATWRASAAATRAPADVVWASDRGLEETVALTHDLDPDGRWLMAAAAVSYPDGLVTVADAERLARVAAWPEAWAGGRSGEEVQRLLAPRTGVPRLTGSEVAVNADNRITSPEEPWLQLLLEDADGLLRVDLGPFESGRSVRAASVPQCERGCLLRSVTLGRRAGLPLEMSGSFDLSTLTVDGQDREGGPAALDLRPATAGATNIQGLNTQGERALVDVETPSRGGTATLTVGGVAPLTPALVGANAQWTTSPGPEGSTRLEVPDGALDVALAATAASVPFFGPAGVLVDYSALVARHDTFDQLARVRVLARADTPPDMVASLRSAGLTVETTLAAERTALDDSAYALALRLYGVSAALVLLLALAGLVLSTLVQLPARRRDAAALRVVGVRRNQVLGAVVRELGVVLGTAALAGVAAGLVAQVLVLRTLTLGHAQELTTPEPSTTLDPGRVLLLVVGVVLVLGVVAFSSAAATVRGARGATLRESAR